MASEVLFDVDASEIVAKLHLAAQQQANPKLKPYNGFVINTGVLNNDPNGSPEKIGKVRFDLNNKLSTFQLGAVVDVEYKQSFDVDKALNDVESVGAKWYGGKIDAKADSPERKNFDAAVKLAIEKFTQLGISKKEDDFTAENSDAFKEKVAEMRKELEDAMKKEKDEYEATVGKIKKAATEALKIYLGVFAGKDNVDNFNESSVGMMNISNTVKDSTDKNLVKTYEIQPMPDQENGQLIAQFKQNALKNPGKPNCKLRVCFYVLYSLNVEK